MCAKNIDKEAKAAEKAAAKAAAQEAKAAKAKTKTKAKRAREIPEAFFISTLRRVGPSGIRPPKRRCVFASIPS